MTCGPDVRERFGAKIEGWATYVEAVGACVGSEPKRLVDRLQVGKRRLRDALECLERETQDATSLAQRLRINLLCASGGLRRELSSSCANSLGHYRSQKRAITSGIAAVERELNAVGRLFRYSEGHALSRAVERTVRAIVRLEAELDAGELRFHPMLGEGRHRAGADHDVAEQVRSLSSTIFLARRLTTEQPNLIEAEIAQGIARLRNLLASRSA